MIGQKRSNVGGISGGCGRYGRLLVWQLMVAVLCGSGPACTSSEREEAEWVAPCVPRITVAVAPALNFSGCPDFDAARVGDLMASELSEVPEIGVIGVNRVLAILAEQGIGQIQSPEHALQVCDRLGADGLLVFAVTEYDAYTPVVGMVAQVYGRRKAEPAIDPVATSRMARPFPVAPRDDSLQPWAQVQRTFNAEHEAVQKDVKHFADSRKAGESPYGWRKYLASQQWFLRYCCYRVATDLMEQQF